MQKSKWDKELESRMVKDLLSGWYGSRRAASEMMFHHEKIDKIGDVADRILNKLHSRNCYVNMHVAAEWEQIAGKQLAAVTRFVGVKDGCAEVEVFHPIYLREMAMPLKSLLLKRIQQITGEEHCRDLYFRASGGDRRAESGNSAARTKSKWSKN